MHVCVRVHVRVCTCGLRARTRSSADDLHYGGGEEAHAVRPSLDVVDVALPAPVQMLLQDLETH